VQRIARYDCSLKVFFVRAVHKFQFQDAGGRVKSGGLHAPRPFAPRRVRNREMKTFLGHPGGGAKSVRPQRPRPIAPSFYNAKRQNAEKPTRAPTRPRARLTNMKTLAPIHRKAVNQSAHDAARRFELETRDRWLKELTDALEAGASYAQIQARIAELSTNQT